jgi:integrase
MATLYKQPKSPFYFARYFDADGNRVSKSTGISAKREAQRIADGYEAEARDLRNKQSSLPKAFAVILEQVTREAVSGQLTLTRAEEFVKRLHKLANPQHEERTLRQFWQAWVEEQERHVGSSTARGYAQDLAIFAETAGKRVMDSPIQELTTAQCNAAIDKARKSSDRKASTINKMLSSLRRVMETAISQGLATHNPAKQCRSLSETDSIERAPFTAQEIRAMLDHKQTSDEWKGAITIAAHTGLRLSDVLSLNDKHVNGTRIVIMPSKTSNQKKVITVPLTPLCIAWLGERKGYFFPTLREQLTPTTSMQFAAIMQRAGVPRQITQAGGLKASRSFHSLRHTFASWLAEADIHADVRQKLTGHSSSKIHQRYTHHDEALDRAVATLPSL